MALVFIGTGDEWESEGFDRPDMELPGQQVELLEKVAAANPNTVVVLNTGSPISVPWLDQVAAVVEAWFPGQECGNAIADVLFGDVNPSGRLSQSWPVYLEDNPAPFLIRPENPSPCETLPDSDGNDYLFRVQAYRNRASVEFSHIITDGTGGLIFFGLLLGIVFHRSRFCFVRAFRDPYMTGESEMIKAIALSLLVYGFGSAVIKWSYIQPPNMGVVQPFWLGTLLGGTIFGIGMVLAGGCGTSTLWRAGEGHIKLMITLVFFALSNSVVDKIKDNTNLASKLGSKLFMPDVLSWQIAIPVFLAILLVWVLLADWNEKTEKFVIF